MDFIKDYELHNGILSVGFDLIFLMLEEFILCWLDAKELFLILDAWLLFWLIAEDAYWLS